MAQQTTTTIGSIDAVVVHRPVLQAYQILHWGFIALPIIAGIDKFFNVLTVWHQYLAPQFSRFGSDLVMQIVGIIEIAAGLIVAFKPRFGGYLVAAWLWGIILNLLIGQNFYDIALRDFGLSFGALALARLSTEIFSHQKPM
jgi:hypothetical protein